MDIQAQSHSQSLFGEGDKQACCLSYLQKLDKLLDTNQSSKKGDIHVRFLYQKKNQKCTHWRPQNHW